MSKQPVFRDPCMGLGRNRCTLLAGLMIVVAFVLGLLAQIENYSTFVELRDHGRIAVGQITAREYGSGCPDGSCKPSYSTSYTVVIEGQSFSEIVYGQPIYDAYREGDAVDVLYSPDNPARHKIADDNTFDLPTALFQLLVTSFIAGPMVGFFASWVVVYFLLPTHRRPNSLPPSQLSPPAA